MNTCLLFMLVELIVSWEAVNPLKSSTILSYYSHSVHCPSLYTEYSVWNWSYPPPKWHLLMNVAYKIWFCFISISNTLVAGVLLASVIPNKSHFIFSKIMKVLKYFRIFICIWFLRVPKGSTRERILNRIDIIARGKSIWSSENSFHEILN